jgi:transposase-like protein
MPEKRKQYSPQEKVAILRRHLLEEVAVSDLCDQYGLHPTVFYRWQKEFFEHGAAAFQHQQALTEKQLEKKILRLEAKLRQKNEVLSEVMEEHVRLKKSLGES